MRVGIFVSEVWLSIDSTWKDFLKKTALPLNTCIYTWASKNNFLIWRLHYFQSLVFKIKY